MLKPSNPYNVLSETISTENVQKMGEMITLKTLRSYCIYARHSLERLYIGLVKDLNRCNEPTHVFSDAYDLVQEATYFLCQFIGKSLNDVYAIQKDKIITIKKAAYTLVSRHIDRIRRTINRSRDINDYTEELSVEIDTYQEKDYANVDNTIARMGLSPCEHEVLDCYMAGMTCFEIAEFLGVNRVTVWRRRQRVQVKWKTLFF